MQDERKHYPQEVENYTTAFFVSFGMLVFMGLFAIWAIWGMLVAAFVSWSADRALVLDYRRRSDR